MRGLFYVEWANKGHKDSTTNTELRTWRRKGPSVLGKASGETDGSSADLHQNFERSLKIIQDQQ